MSDRAQRGRYKTSSRGEKEWTNRGEFEYAEMPNRLVGLRFNIRPAVKNVNFHFTVRYSSGSHIAKKAFGLSCDTSSVYYSVNSSRNRDGFVRRRRHFHTVVET